MQGRVLEVLNCHFNGHALSSIEKGIFVTLCSNLQNICINVYFSHGSHFVKFCYFNMFLFFFYRHLGNIGTILSMRTAESPRFSSTDVEVKQ